MSVGPSGMEAPSSFQDSPDLEYLKEMGRGPFGVLWLGRILSGSEAGRLVTARRLSLAQLDATDVERVLKACRAYSHVAHPSLAKFLGAHKCKEYLVLLEESVVGVPLSALQDLTLARHATIPTSIAARLVLDVLRTAVALRQTCTDQGLAMPSRIIFPDAITVAGFGETLLSVVGISSELCRCQRVREHPAMIEVLDPDELVGKIAPDERYEVFTAGALLWKLLVVQGLFGDYGNQQSLNRVLHGSSLSAEDSERLKLCVPQPIAAIIRRATLRNPSLRYQSLQDMLKPFEELPPGLLGRETQVRAWLENLARDFLFDLQWSAGLSKSQLDSQPPNADGPSSQRPSFTDAFLPWDHPTLAARGVTFRPVRDDHLGNLAPAAALGKESCPATTVSSNLIAIREPPRKIRWAYLAGTLFGLGLAMGLSYLGSRIRFLPTSAASTPVPSLVSTSPANVSSSVRVDPASPLASKGVPDSERITERSAKVEPDSSNEPAQDAGHDRSVVDKTASDHSVSAEPRIGSRAPVRLRSINRGTNDRWGI